LTLIDLEDLTDWDGLFGWFMDYVASNPSILDARIPGASVKNWYRAAQQSMVHRPSL